MSQKKVDASFFSKDAVDLLRLLAKHRVRYLIVGGGAVILYEGADDRQNGPPGRLFHRIG